VYIYHIRLTIQSVRPVSESGDDPVNKVRAPKCQTDLSHIFQGVLKSWIEAIEEKDLDRFTETFAEINEFFRHARYQQNRHEKLGDSLCQQAYYRAITPNIKQLSRYKVGTDTVYGEITAHIPDVMIEEGGLTEASHFVDLGSGIGNMVCLMSMRTGCSSFGVEIMTPLAALANTFVQQSMLRAEGVGLKVGQVKLIEADMLKSELVKENITAADVVLVNNKIFSAESAWFLDKSFCI
jgi:hypothetical protein